MTFARYGLVLEYVRGGCAWEERVKSNLDKCYTFNDLWTGNVVALLYIHRAPPPRYAYSSIVEMKRMYIWRLFHI